MKTINYLKRTLPRILATVIALPVIAQVAVVDISNPTNPVVTYESIIQPQEK